MNKQYSQMMFERYLELLASTVNTDQWCYYNSDTYKKQLHSKKNIGTYGRTTYPTSVLVHTVEYVWALSVLTTVIVKFNMIKNIHM